MEKRNEEDELVEEQKAEATGSAKKTSFAKKSESFHIKNDEDIADVPQMRKATTRYEKPPDMAQKGSMKSLTSADDKHNPPERNRSKKNVTIKEEIEEKEEGGEKEKSTFQKANTMK